MFGIYGKLMKIKFNVYVQIPIGDEIHNFICYNIKKISIGDELNIGELMKIKVKLINSVNNEDILVTGELINKGE